MEIRAILNKPYTEKQKVEFIVEYNHKQGLPIVETETELQALCYSVTELENQKQERIAMLSLTAADVERGIYKATGKDFEDVIALVTELQPVGLDIKALKIELKANNFYRGNPYVDSVGKLLGFTKEQLDEFFETNDYTKLISD